MFDNLDQAVERRILRYLICVGSAAFIALWYDWTIAFCAPLFTAKFLVDKPHFTALHIKQLLFALISTFALAFVVSTGFPEYKIAFLAVYAAGMLWGYYLFTDPKWQMFATFWMVNLILTPTLTIVDQKAALDVAFGLAFSGVVAVGLCFLGHVYLPEDNVPQEESFPPSPLPHEIRWSASLRALCVSFPLVAFFFYYQMSQVLLTVAFVSLLSLLLSSDKATKTTAFFVISNVFGGVVAFLAFVMISLVPNMFFYMLVVLLVIAYFGTKIYSEPAKAPLYATAFTGFYRATWLIHEQWCSGRQVLFADLAAGFGDGVYGVYGLFP